MPGLVEVRAPLEVEASIDTARSFCTFLNVVLSVIFSQR